MLRLLFEKKGNAVWISHLDLMRMFQRAFQRAKLNLTHTQGFNPRPSVSIALPLSVGIESSCELLDFKLDGQQIPCAEIRERLNKTLVSGIHVLDVYEDGRKIRDLALLNTRITLEFDGGVPENAGTQIETLLKQESVIMEKRSKSGMTEQNIIPMIRRFHITNPDPNTLYLDALICCQNPTLNPMQIVHAVEKYLPGLPVSFAKCARMEIYDEDEKVFR